MPSIRPIAGRSALLAVLASAAALLIAAVPASAAPPAACDDGLTAYVLDPLDVNDQVLVGADLNLDGTVCVTVNANDYAVVIDNSDLASLAGVGLPAGFVSIDVTDSLFGDVSLVDQRGNRNNAGAVFLTQNNGGQYFSHNNALRNINLKGIVIEDAVSIG